MVSIASKMINLLIDYYYRYLKKIHDLFLIVSAGRLISINLHQLEVTFSLRIIHLYSNKNNLLIIEINQLVIKAQIFFFLTR